MGLFDKALKKSIEENSNYSTLLGGYQIGSGGSATVEIKEDLAKKLSTVTACLNLISGTISKLPIELLDKESGLYVKDDRLRILNGECGEYMLSMQLWENMINDYLLYGSAYALKHMRGNKLLGLTYIHPNNVSLNVAYVGINKKATFTLTLHDRTFEVEPDQLLIFVRSSQDGLQGKGVLHSGANIVYQGVDEQSKSREFFKNGALPTGVLKSQSKLSENSLKRLRESWNRLMTGAGTGGKTVILEEGLEYESISFNPETLQLLNSKSFTVSEICRLFNVPQELVDSSIKGAYSSLEQQNLHYLYYTISPIIAKLVKSLNKSLLKEIEKDSKTFEIDTDVIQMTSLIDRYNAHNIALGNGTLTVNEVRAEEGRAPIEGGDIRFIPLNMAYMDNKGQVIVPNYLHTGKTEEPKGSKGEDVKGGE